MESGPRVGVTLRAAVVVAFCLTQSSVADMIPRFPKNADETCEYLTRTATRCPIPEHFIGPNEFLFRDSRLKPVLDQCKASPMTVPNAIKTSSDFREWKVDFLTFVTFSPRCGLLLEPSQIGKEEIIMAVDKFLSWRPGIPGQNCVMNEKILQYIGDNILMFVDPLRELSALLKGLPTNLLLHIMKIVPHAMCGLLDQLQIVTPKQISDVVDALVADCDSGTTLSHWTDCSWKDAPPIAIKAIAVQRSAESDTGSTLCLPPGAGRQCAIGSTCIKLLCRQDFNIRKCLSPCAKLLSESECEDPPSTNITAQCERSLADAEAVPLADPEMATPADLSAVASCLLRRPRDQARYPAGVLCQLSPVFIHSTKYKAKFTEWEVLFAPRCDNCTGSIHTTALLSPSCSPSAVKLVETTVKHVETLIRGTKQRKMLFKLFHQIYINMDIEFRDMVCTQSFLEVFTVETVKGIGSSNLQPALLEMMKCDEPPATSKILAILVQGKTCPFSLLVNFGPHLIRIGAMTDHCFETLQTREALKVCSIIMSDKEHRVSKRKINILCEVLDKLPGDTTCILCPLKSSRTSTNMSISPAARTTRCLHILTLPTRRRTSAQAQELLDCPPCLPPANGDSSQEDGAAETWCGARTVTLGQLEEAAGEVCNLPFEEMKCFFERAERLVQEALRRNITRDHFSDLQFTFPFINPGTPPMIDDIPFKCRSRYPVKVARLLKGYIRKYRQRSTRERRETPCDTLELIESLDFEEGSFPSVLDLEDLRCLTPQETVGVVTSHSLGMDDWTPGQASILLAKVMESLGKNDISELDTAELRSLGLILIALSPEEIKQLSYLDDTLFGLIGSSAQWSKAQMQALVTKYLRQEGKTHVELTLQDVLLLQNLLGGFTYCQLREIPNAAIIGASAVLGHIPMCDFDLLEEIITHLKRAHGAVSTWDESQLSEFANILGGLSAEEINAVGPMIVSHIPEYVWRYHIDKTIFNELSEAIKDVLPDKLRALALQDLPPCDGMDVRRMETTTRASEDSSRPMSGGSFQVAGQTSFLASLMFLGFILK